MSTVGKSTVLFSLFLARWHLLVLTGIFFQVAQLGVLATPLPIGVECRDAYDTVYLAFQSLRRTEAQNRDKAEVTTGQTGQGLLSFCLDKAAAGPSGDFHFHRRKANVPLFFCFLSSLFLR